MNSLYDLRDWFYECDRLLFLAEVHCHKDNVVPSGHRFSHEITSLCLENFLENIREMCKEGDCKTNFESEVPRDDVLFLEDTLDKISSCNWKQLDLESVLKAQSIVKKLTCALNSDILENSQLRSYPNIYNACQIK